MREMVFVSSKGCAHVQYHPPSGAVLVWDNLANTWIWMSTDKLKFK